MPLLHCPLPHTLDPVKRTDCTDILYIYASVQMFSFCAACAIKGEGMGGSILSPALVATPILQGYIEGPKWDIFFVFRQCDGLRRRRIRPPTQKAIGLQYIGPQYSIIRTISSIFRVEKNLDPLLLGLSRGDRRKKGAKRTKKVPMQQ